MRLIPVGRWNLVLLFLAAMTLRAVGLPRAFDQPDWRAVDVAAVARNFHREGLDPLRPRVDWRGDGPGYAEMEFPFQSTLMAVSYRSFGVHESAGRWIAYGVSAIGLLALFQLARLRLSPVGATAACAFFTVNPLLVNQATALQPETFMTTGIAAAVLGFERWLADDRPRDALLAGVAASFAILAKAPAAFLGPLFLARLLVRRGWRGFRSGWVWLIAVAALVPAALWYRHAHGLYVTYGNSLGLSNESHWIGLDMLETPGVFLRLVRLDVRGAWTPFGAALVAAAFLLSRSMRRRGLEWAWVGSVSLYLLAAARTTSDDWASYYHVAMVPPAGLLLGAALEACIAAGAAARERRLGLALRTSATLLVLWLCAATGLEAARHTKPRAPHAYYRSAVHAQDVVPPNHLIVASGGICSDAWGHPVAYNAPYFFYWLDCKGWNLCAGEQSVTALEALARKGAEFYVAEKSQLGSAAGFEGALRGRFPVLEDDGRVIVFRLTTASDLSMTHARPKQAG